MLLIQRGGREHEDEECGEGRRNCTLCCLACRSGGAADSADVSDDTEEAAYEATDDEVEEGSYLSVVEDGVLKLPGLTFTLPDELAEELPDVAGTAVVDSQFEEAYIYLYDPSEDVMVQGMEPAFLWIMGIPVDDSLENFLP